MSRKTYQLTVHQIPSELANALQKEQTRSGRPLNDLILELLRRGLDNLPAPPPEAKPKAELIPEPPSGERVRVVLETTPSLVAEITEHAKEILGLKEGLDVHASFKATGIDVFR